ncbi:hypothetical protein RvY_08685-2 [Ramazzottius varieornatus]|uniref:NAD-dependent epimerase/dehydratase domain-containing protein n=1 Tax=Ramazzottius varieornatus TaxID=947166 RepID=A0A1D1V6U3_RAMVA|nr:hypothetical protein RvY_08685-2 [Ramazzottius varieornatus]
MSAVIRHGSEDDITLAEVDRVAVVGGGGYVGWHIVLRLVGCGHSVAIMDLGLFPEAREAVSANKSITFFRVDIREKEELLDSFKRYRPKTVYHVASYGKQTVA